MVWIRAGGNSASCRLRITNTKEAGAVNNQGRHRWGCPALPGLMLFLFDLQENPFVVDEETGA